MVKGASPGPAPAFHDEGLGLSTQEQQYDVTAAVNEIRRHVDRWRDIPGPNNWPGVTPETARLLLHWRQHNFSNYRQLIESRRGAEFVPQAQAAGKGKGRTAAVPGPFNSRQQYDVTAAVNEIRRHVDLHSRWRYANRAVASLASYRPFFCQVEAVETLIWLTEVAPRLSAADRRALDRLADVNQEANPELLRIALKLATGAGKTTVMAMVIAWQTINAVRHPNSRRFTRGFLVVTPGLTIKDRLRVLQPNDPDSYYASRELVPAGMLEDIQRARIVITNYHSLRLRERIEISAGGRALLQGHGEPLDTLESEGQMVQRVMPGLMSIKNVMVLNDEGHHCYRHKPGDDDEGRLAGEELQEANRNNEEARLWISGLEIVKRKLGLRQVVDLSATPFFLRGSGYAEGTLFPWTVSDFSLMDAIESGIVKLPRVPVADNIPGEQVPVFRNLWEHIRGDMPKAGRGRSGNLDPLSLPTTLQTALEALYGHYKNTFEQMGKQTGLRRRPASLWSATTLQLPSWFMTTFQGLSGRTRTGQPACKMGGWNCSATSTSTTIATRYPELY